MAPEEPAVARIAPVAADLRTERVREFFDHVEALEGSDRITQFNIVRTLAHHPDLGIPYLSFGMHIRRFSSLPPRVRELVTLRTAWLYGCDYEWSKHAAAARGVGVGEEEIEATRVGSASGVWAGFDKALMEAVEQLRSDTSIEDGVWEVLAAHLDTPQLLDFLFTVGSYAMLAMVLRGVRVQPEA